MNRITKRATQFVNDPNSEVWFVTIMFAIGYFMIAVIITYFVFFKIFPEFWWVGAFVVVGCAIYSIWKEDRQPQKSEFAHLFESDIHGEELVKSTIEDMDEYITKQMQDDDIKTKTRGKKRKGEKETNSGSVIITPTSKEFIKSAKAAGIQHGFSVNKVQNPHER